MEKVVEKIKDNKIKLLIMLVIIISVVFVIVFQKSYASGTATSEGTVVFEDIGHYAFATAGSNLAYRGTELCSGGYSLIRELPDWFNPMQLGVGPQAIPAVNNMTGSYLDYDGEAKLGILSTMIYNPERPNQNYNALILYPDKTWRIYENIRGKNQEIELKGPGWYYVSILSLYNAPQQAWGITAIYENSNLPNSYVKLLDLNSFRLEGSSDSIPTELIVPFNSQFTFKNSINIFGLITGAGQCGWPVYTETASSKDRAWAILEDDSLYQLYDRGDGHFTGRTNTDFANGIYASTKNTDLPGGELDIFEEKLDKSYFGGKTIKGLKFRKDGNVGLWINLVGLSIEIKEYKIVYNLDGGTVDGTNPVIYTEDTETFTLINPTKPGYTFTGWTGTGLTGNTMTVTIPKGSTGNREYTAHFEKEKFTITYKTDGHGIVSRQNERLEKNENPIGITNTPNQGYKYLLTKCDRDVELNNGIVINKNRDITLEQIKQIKMNDNITCTVYHRPDITINKCD